MIGLLVLSIFFGHVAAIYDVAKQAPSGVVGLGDLSAGTSTLGLPKPTCLVPLSTAARLRPSSPPPCVACQRQAAASWLETRPRRPTRTRLRCCRVDSGRV